MLIHSPILMELHFRLHGTDPMIICFVGRCPHSENIVDASAFWDNFHAIMSGVREKYPSAEILMLVDAKARIGSVESEFVGAASY